MTLNLGSGQVPVAADRLRRRRGRRLRDDPAVVVQLQDVGVNLDITPRVTYEGEIVLDMSVENSALGAERRRRRPVGAVVHVAQGARPTCGCAKGKSNLLAGLDRRGHSARPPGLARADPTFRVSSRFRGQRHPRQDTDIVMLITPHIVRDHELTKEDVGYIYIGTQAERRPVRPAAADRAAARGGRRRRRPRPAPQPAGQSRRRRRAGPPVAQPRRRPADESAGAARHVAGAGHGDAAGRDAASAGHAPPPVTTRSRRRCRPPVNAESAPAGDDADRPTRAAADGSVARRAESSAASPAGSRRPRRRSPPAQIIVTPPGTSSGRGGPYTVPISINNASRVSVVTLTITYNPAVLRVRTVQDGTFMRQGGRDRHVHAAHRRRRRAGSTSRSRGPAIRPARPERDCWRR